MFQIQFCSECGKPKDQEQEWPPKHMFIPFRRNKAAFLRFAAAVLKDLFAGHISPYEQEKIF